MVTLSKLNPENDQEVFDFVVEKLYRQGKRSMAKRPGAMYEEETYCVYRSDDGCKCAVGQLIPYDMYTSKMEGNTIYALLGNTNSDNKKLKIIAEYLGKFNDILLSWLQTIHDFHYSSMEDFLDSIIDRKFCFEEIGVKVDIAEKLKAEYTQLQKD